MSGQDVYTEVDPDSVRSLADELGGDACREILALFLSELEATLGLLREGGDDASRLLHNLSSGAKTVGAAGVAALCDALQARSDAGHLDELTKRGRALSDELSRLTEELWA